MQGTARYDPSAGDNPGLQWSHSPPVFVLAAGIAAPVIIPDAALCCFFEKLTVINLAESPPVLPKGLVVVRTYQASTRG